VKCGLGTYEKPTASSSVCYPCDDINCLKCDATQCITCKKYYYRASLSKCLPCPTNCLNCTDSNACLVCDYGYIMTPNGVCTFPGGGKYGSLAPNGKYYPCPAGCKQCTLTVSNILTCLILDEGYHASYL
jgi:hypothetical protein